MMVFLEKINYIIATYSIFDELNSQKIFLV